MSVALRSAGSLSRRLSAAVVVAMLSVLLLSLAAVIHQARRAVADELQGTAALLQILQDAQPEGSVVWSERLAQAALESRHWCLPASCPKTAEADVPGWFDAWVRPGQTPAAVAGLQLDPSAEIIEAWRDARPLLLSIAVLGLVVNLSVLGLLLKALGPLEGVRQALRRLAAGETGVWLPGQVSGELRGLVDDLGALDRALADGRARQSALLRRLLELQESERAVIARELHDEIGQALAGLDLQLSMIRESGNALECARLARADVAKLYDHLHGLLARLRPPALDDLGLGAALETLVADWSKRSTRVGFVCEIQTPGDAFPDPDTALHLYRIAQEAISNAVRHAHARRIALTLTGEARDLRLTIEDDGRGLSPRHSRDGFGLAGLKERARLMGADLTISSPVGHGTRVDLVLRS